MEPVAQGTTGRIANPWRRRGAIAIGAVLVAAWVVALPRIISIWPSRLTYRDIAGLAPFRELETTGTLSTANVLTLGMDVAKAHDPAREAMIAAVRADPCTALFGTQTDARLPVAFFSDFNCPNCRVLEAILNSYDAQNPGVLRIVHHELPLLGAASTIASQAVLAADLQGGYTAMHDRLVRARLATDLNYVVRMAESVGLDGKRLVADMQTPQITAALDMAKAIATVFGFYGTPSTVIGRTVFLGAIPEADLRQIIASELAAPTLVCSTG